MDWRDKHKSTPANCQASLAYKKSIILTIELQLNLRAYKPTKRLRAVRSVDALTGKPKKTDEKISRPRKCPKGYHWDAAQNKCVDAEPLDPNRERKTRKSPKKRRPTRIDEEDLSATPELQIGSQQMGRDKWAIVIDETASDDVVQY